MLIYCFTSDYKMHIKYPYHLNFVDEWMRIPSSTWFCFEFVHIYPLIRPGIIFTLREKFYNSVKVQASYFCFLMLQTFSDVWLLQPHIVYEKRNSSRKLIWLYFVRKRLSFPWWWWLVFFFVDLKESYFFGNNFRKLIISFE